MASALPKNASCVSMKCMSPSRVLLLLFLSACLDSSLFEAEPLDEMEAPFDEVEKPLDDVSVKSCSWSFSIRDLQFFTLSGQLTTNLMPNTEYDMVVVADAGTPAICIAHLDGADNHQSMCDDTGSWGSQRAIIRRVKTSENAHVVTVWARVCQVCDGWTCGFAKQQHVPESATPAASTINVLSNPMVGGLQVVGGQDFHFPHSFGTKEQFCKDEGFDFSVGGNLGFPESGVGRYFDSNWKSVSDVDLHFFSSISCRSVDP